MGKNLRQGKLELSFTLAPLSTGNMTWNQFLNLSETLFPHLKNGNKDLCTVFSVENQMIMSIHSRCLINVSVFSRWLGAKEARAEHDDAETWTCTKQY